MADADSPPAMQDVDLNEKDEDDDLFGQVIQKKPAAAEGASGPVTSGESNVTALSNDTERLKIQPAAAELAISSDHQNQNQNRASTGSAGFAKNSTEKRKIEPAVDLFRSDSDAKPIAEIDKHVTSTDKLKVTSSGVSGVSSGGLEPIVESAFEISVSEPQKIGDGMSSYVSYLVTTKTSLPAFRKQSMTVRRRFSDFLGLRDKLAAKHVSEGRLVASAPEKSVVALARVKVSRNVDPSSSEFIEKRRAALERFLVALSEHPALRVDPDFREFLELESELPRATQTATLSARNVLKFFSSTADSVTKLAAEKFDEPDEVVQQRVAKLNELEEYLSKFYAAYDSLVENRRELASSAASFAKSVSLLSTADENASLSKAMAALATTFERLEVLEAELASTELHRVVDECHDWLALIVALKETLNERQKTHRLWKHTERELEKKREAKVKLELSARSPEKIRQAESEIRDLEEKLERTSKQFERVTAAVKKEFDWFDAKRIRDLRHSIIASLEKFAVFEERVLAEWETFAAAVKLIQT